MVVKIPTRIGAFSPRRPPRKSVTIYEEPDATDVFDVVGV